VNETASERLLTVEDLYSLPDDGILYELQCGCLLSEPLPGGRHGRIAARIVTLLSGHVVARRLGVVYANDTGYVLARSPDTVRGPDVSFVSQSRFEAIGDVATAVPGPPDLAVEVISPSNSPSQIHAKVADYLAAGTRLVWVVDPERRRVTIHRSLLSPRLLGTADTLDGEDVLPGFSVKVSELFEI